ncbi:hypothetical protein DRO21_05235 [archaeon]|nr:MAG: hypothetical protein DRO21_05235 [archaeon]
MKNLRALEENGIDEDLSLAWYWLLRVPFYTLSPKLRKPKKKSPPSGLLFLGAYTECIAFARLRSPRNSKKASVST